MQKSQHTPHNSSAYILVLNGRILEVPPPRPQKQRCGSAGERYIGRKLTRRLYPESVLWLFY